MNFWIIFWFYCSICPYSLKIAFISAFTLHQWSSEKYFENHEYFWMWQKVWFYFFLYKKLYFNSLINQNRFCTKHTIHKKNCRCWVQGLKFLASNWSDDTFLDIYLSDEIQFYSNWSNNLLVSWFLTGQKMHLWS